MTRRVGCWWSRATSNPFDNRERQFLLLFLASALIMLPIAWMFARRLADPFEQFADAAERLGRDPSTAPPDIAGPAEVERASQAFRQMQQRLQAYVSDRTQMLGAIAHDLRTPLTRLAFRLEALDQPARDAMARDVAEMEAMVAATMDLARSDGAQSERQRLDLGSLLERVADDMALTGRKVSAEVLDSLVVDGDPVALGGCSQTCSTMARPMAGWPMHACGATATLRWSMWTTRARAACRRDGAGVRALLPGGTVPQPRDRRDRPRACRSSALGCAGAWWRCHAGKPTRRRAAGAADIASGAVREALEGLISPG
jgi:HAMP domain-containing protein